MSSDSSSKTWPPPQRKLAAPCNVTQTISKADNNESNSDDSDNDQTSNPIVENNELEDNQEKTESNSSSKVLTSSLSPAKSGNCSNYSISEANAQIFKDIVNKKKRKTSSNLKSRNTTTKEKQQKQLLLSDLAIPSGEKNNKLIKNVATQEEVKKFGVKSQQDNLQG